MQFTRFLAALSIASLAVALPAPVAVIEQRDIVSVPDILNGAKDNVHGILGQIDTLLQDGGLTQATLGPLVDDLVGALDTISVDLGNLVVTATSPVGGLPIKRQTVDPKVVADILGSIITDVNQTLNGLVGTAAQIPGVATLLIGVNTSLTQVISVVESLVPGVLAIVTGLVGTLTSTLGQLLGSLGLGSLLGSLGL
ncbi:hypothetical protein EXIGLDRAFT_830481 [Exidia glandulosa HHB12029]|uniref:Sc15 protein n=1 Tax=Exidia glandulosa HHB12029 TaxID=1314781 RepID=A0A165NJM6_EXIGL|nr:hypothetical protein EXIGLDRAFT_830481 [Exidia glandulosa HHB12029]